MRGKYYIYIYIYIYICIKQNTLVGIFSKSISRKFQYCQVVSFSNLMYRCNVIPINVPESYFVDIEKTNFTVYMQREKTW